jgi:hypothetical protein
MSNMMVIPTLSTHTVSWISGICSVPDKRLQAYHHDSVPLIMYWLVVYFTTLFSATRLYSVDNRVTRKWWWIEKDLVGSGRGLTLRYYPGIFLHGLRKTLNWIMYLRTKCNGYTAVSRSPKPRSDKCSTMTEASRDWGKQAEARFDPDISSIRDFFVQLGHRNVFVT